MKILAIICEFNPFHNGHKYLLEQAKKLSGCDAVLCIMSGSFTQRGDLCILDKYVRAKHAVMAGADCVIQLPAPFAVAPAEIFAKGAIKILTSVSDVYGIAFGCESGTKDDFERTAGLLIDESEQFKSVLNKKLDLGESYIKSYSSAVISCGGDGWIVDSPNNILGLEYTKAIRRINANLDILPVKRIGSGYNDGQLYDNFSSASAIRNNIACEKVKGNLPDFVYGDLNTETDVREFESVLRNCLFFADTEKLKCIYGCSEGLENKLKGLENFALSDIIEKATSKRYSSSRIKRILCANALNLYQADTERFLQADLYIKPLAVKKDRAAELLSALSKSRYPVVTGIDTNKLSPAAKECFEKDRSEYSLFNHINKTDKKDYMILV